jgi:hypothetical protein
MRTRILALVAALAACAGTALVAVPAAQASPRPPINQGWSSCGGSATANYCVVSESRNGTAVMPGDTYQPYVDLLDSGTVRYGVYRVVGPDSFGDVDPADTYELTVRTGTIHPRELYGNVRNVDMTVGTDSTGWYFTISFQPTPLHHVGYNGDTRTCTIDGGCGDNTWEASLDYDGFVTGYVTDLQSSGLSASEIGWRTGMVRAYNAQDENTYYDPDLNSLVIQLANPHLTGTGAPATGSYQMFFPTSYMVNVMNVPDPSSLTSGSFVVTRGTGDSSIPVPFAVTQQPGGVRVTIAGITYSRPTYRIHPKPRVPGKPRITGVKKLTGAARSSFLPPYADGNRKVDLYQAACRKNSTVPFKFKTGTKSPITVTALPTGTVYCQVRAHNSIGWGPWGKAAASHT